MFCVYIRQLNELHTFQKWEDRIAFTDAIRNNPDILSHTTWSQDDTVPMLPMYANATRIDHK